MSIDNLARAKEYYEAMGGKNSDKVEAYLHKQVELKGPLGHLTGKEAVFQASKNYMNRLSSLKVRTILGKESFVSVVYDICIPNLVEKFPASVLLQFSEGLICGIELFYDATPFRAVSEAIFKNK